VIALQQTVFEQAAAESRAGHYLEAWAVAGSEPRARTYVRYHAGDLDAALSEARAGLRGAPGDAWLASIATEIALSLHRGSTAGALLASWRASAAPEDAPRLASASAELAALRATELAAADGIRRARWISACALALALVFLLRFARPRA
jgi:predicted Zn-dependent protease